MRPLSFGLEELETSDMLEPTASETIEFVPTYSLAFCCVN